jgi:hypothetical protein
VTPGGVPPYRRIGHGRSPIINVYVVQRVRIEGADAAGSRGGIDV